MGVRIRHVQDAVCVEFGVTRDNLLSRRRYRAIAYPRHAGYWLSRELTHHSFPEIGLYFGGRDHTTVLHGCKMAEVLRDFDEDYREKTDRIFKKLSQFSDWTIIPENTIQPFRGYTMSCSYKL